MIIFFYFFYKAVATPLRGRLFGCLRTHAPPSMGHSASLNNLNWHVKGCSTKKTPTINHVIAPKCGTYKKNNKTAAVSARINK
jgi:hypothetical protein